MGLFKNLQSINPEPDTNEISTTGHSVVGLGGARYVVTLKTGATPFRSQVADGRWFELSEPQIFVEMFGALGGDPTHDDHPGIQAAIDYNEEFRGGVV